MNPYKKRGATGKSFSPAEVGDTASFNNEVVLTQGSLRALDGGGGGVPKLHVDLKKQ